MASTTWEFKANTRDIDQKLKNATQSLAYMSEEGRRVNATFEVCDADVLKFTQSLGTMGTSAKTMKGQLSELTAAATEVGTRYRQLSDDEKRSPFGQALRQSMEQLNARVIETRTALHDTQRDMGGLTSSAGDASGSLGTLAEKFGVNISSLTKFASASAAVTAALKVGKDAFFRQESGIDAWGEVMETAKGIYSTFLDTLNGGNWGNFLSNLERAIAGSRALYSAIDSFGSIKANNALPISIAEQQLAALRVMKQAGQDVDAQIRATEATLRGLRSQQIDAGKKSGYQGIRNEITSRYNATAGVGNISYGSVTAAIQQIARRGQAYFDEQKAIFDRLTEKGTVTETRYQWGSMGAVETPRFDINALSESERKVYAFAKAVTEGETSIQQYTEIVRQAYDEERSSARDSFRYNRWANAGSGGGSGKSSASSASPSPELTIQPAALNLAAANMGDVFANAARDKFASLQQQRGLLTTQIGNTQDPEVRARLTAELEKIDGRLSAMTMPDGMWVDGDGLVIPLRLDIDREALKSQASNFGDLLTATKSGAKLSGETSKAWQAATKAISQAGSAMQQISNPSAKVAGIIAEAVANVALGFAMATASPVTTATGIFGWIAAATAGLATMGATIAAVKSATKMADGGIVGGNSLGGDRLVTRINSGEMVINRADQQRLWDTIRGGGGERQPIKVEGVIRGEDIYISQKSYRNRTGKK